MMGVVPRESCGVRKFPNQSSGEWGVKLIEGERLVKGWLAPEKETHTT